MNERILLKPNTQLKFTNYEGGVISYIITKELEKGGACIVYDGYYVNNSGDSVPVRIKECYPFKLHISRMDNGELFAQRNEIEYFEEYKRRMRKSFDISNELLKTSSLTNSVSNTLDIYELNNTVYIVSCYAEGSDLAKCEIKELKDAVKIVLSAAKSIEKVHNKGYLYLDLKPENIFIFDETYELIQLFDFDSIIPMNAKNNILEYRISYSAGFAPIEQKMGILSKLGKYSDIYSVGALLFYLLFGKAPSAFDCGEETIYDFTEMKWKNCYRDKLYTKLTEFFHHTLESYYKQRYQSMDMAVGQLEEIEEYADISKPFIYSSVVLGNGFVVGREKEINSLINWSQSGSTCIFVSGMGGIGKSTVVREFLKRSGDNFENIIYLYFDESLCNTFIDDIRFSIHNCEKRIEETNTEYYKRKIKTARELVCQADSILIIDNYNGELNNDFIDILNVGWKVIAVTRKNMENMGYDTLFIQHLSDRNDLRRLFSVKIGYEFSGEQIDKLERMIDMVEGHTLALELIAGQIANSYLSIEQALELTEKYGFSGIGKEKVDLIKDGKRYYEKIEQIIRAVYNIGAMNAQKRKILKIISLFDAPGIWLKELKRLLHLESFDEVNELRDTGWINIVNECAVLHPLIQETIQQAEWNDDYRNTAAAEMQELFEIIKFHGKNDEAAAASKKTLNDALKMAKSILKYCGRDNELSQRKIYKNLMSAAVLNMPKDQEEYILSHAEKLLCDREWKNFYEIMELYDYVVYLYCQREDFESAEKMLDFARQYAEKQADNYVRGLYYEMLSDFYGSVLSVRYFYQNKNWKKLFHDLLDTNNKAISYMRKSEYESAERLLAKNILGRAVLLLRSKPEKAKTVRKLIQEAEGLIKEYMPDKKEDFSRKYIYGKKILSNKKEIFGKKSVSEKKDIFDKKGLSDKNVLEDKKDVFDKRRKNEYLKICSVYYMAWAWYYGLCEPDKELVLQNLELSNQINEMDGMSELDNIDYYIIPAANIMCELGELVLALDWLQKGIEICERNLELIPYVRKKADLLSYQLEVWYDIGDMKECDRIIRLVDKENEKNIEIGVYSKIPDEVRKEVNAR